MFRVLSNQHYQHRTNQKLRSWANAVFQNRRVCGQAFPALPSTYPLIPFFFFFCSRPNFLEELARKRLLCRLQEYYWPTIYRAVAAVVQLLIVILLIVKSLSTEIFLSIKNICIGNGLICMIFDINTTSDISKLLYVISWAVRRGEIYVVV